MRFRELLSISDVTFCILIIDGIFGMEADRRSQTVSQLVCEGQLDVSRRQELSIVLNGHQTCIQGGGLTISQFDVL